MAGFLARKRFRGHRSRLSILERFGGKSAHGAPHGEEGDAIAPLAQASARTPCDNMARRTGVEMTASAPPRQGRSGRE
ncbi:hypothetical protein [Burkholderia glumae]|uniref:hypothetical protein n=1 Tax=Burkholderia glumae TaxID=337 RepID=UPI0002F38AC0|nr:hypothetical protein [Burkholderia glumae]